MQPRSPAGPATDRIGPELAGELIELFAREARRVPVPVFLSSLLLASTAWSQLGGSLPWVWLAAVALVLALRWKVLGGLPAAQMDLPAKLRVAVLMSGINGLVQGTSIGFGIVLDTPGRAVLSILLLTLCAGSVATTGGYRPVFVAFVGPMLLALVAMWAIGAPGVSQPWVEYFIAGLVVVFGMLMLQLAQDTFRLLKASFEIRREQVTLNRQLRAALEEAEAANRAKTRFLASASHDLRQPMHTLSLFGAALMMRPLDTATRPIVNHMNTALQALSAQIDALLDVSKLDAGVVPVHPTTFALPPFLEHLAAEYAELAQAKRLALRTECPPEASCSTDEVLLARIVRNLVENAIKYTPAGEVAVRVSAAGPQHWQLSVEDTGIGIPAAEHQRVFEEFYQLHNPERDRSRGLGLGLSIVHRLAQLLGIEIELRSSPGFGTRFDLKVPRGARAGAALSGADRPFDAVHPGTSLAGTRVLVLDDEEAVRQGMQTLLQAYGCEVRLAGSIAEALAQCQDLRPDIALVDLRLRGEEDGIRAIEQLRSRAWMPAILISGDTAPQRIKQAHEAGIPLLHKPVSPRTLYESIEREVQVHTRSRRHGRRNFEWEQGPA